MKDLKGRTDELLAGWREAGVCTDCFRDLRGDVVGEPEQHREWCRADKEDTDE